MDSMTVATAEGVSFAITQRHDGGVNVEMTGVEAMESAYGSPGPIQRTLKLRSLDEAELMHSALGSFIAFHRG